MVGPSTVWNRITKAEFITISDPNFRGIWAQAIRFDLHCFFSPVVVKVDLM